MQLANLFNAKSEREDAPARASSMLEWHEEQRRWDEKYRAHAEITRAELQATVDATPEPADVYRVTKDFETGQFIVSRWVNRVSSQAGNSGFPVYWLDQGHLPYSQRFPTAKAAQAFIKAMIDPTTNQTGFDAKGDLITVDQK